LNDRAVASVFFIFIKSARLYEFIPIIECKAKTIKGGITMIEKSPEQKVREYYEAFKETSDLNEHDHTVVHTIEITLKMLGITIEGVNA
jgi:hypothetical protein